MKNFDLYLNWVTLVFIASCATVPIAISWLLVQLADAL